MDFHQLTTRQRRILELVVSGKTNKEIAAIVHISENTVEYHLVKRIYPALGVRTRGAAASVYLKLAAAALRKSVVDSRGENTTITVVRRQSQSLRRKDEVIRMSICLHAVQSPDEVKQVYSFAVAVLGLPTAKHTLDYYLSQLAIAPELMIYARRYGHIVGCVLASIEDDHVLLGPLAIAQQFTGTGLAAQFMTQVEVATKRYGHNTIILGAFPEDEDFFLTLNYQPHLFVQYPEMAFSPQLKALNTGYDIAFEAESDGWTRLMLRTPKIDKTLQAAYERQFPNCATQTVFIKSL